MERDVAYSYGYDTFRGLCFFSKDGGLPSLLDVKFFDIKILNSSGVR